MRFLRVCSEVIRLLLKYCIYCASAPSLHRESTDSLISEAPIYTSHKKVFCMKTSACRDGTLKDQSNKMGTRWEQHCKTFTPSLHLVPLFVNRRVVEGSWEGIVDCVVHAC